MLRKVFISIILAALLTACQSKNDQTSQSTSKQDITNINDLVDYLTGTKYESDNEFPAGEICNEGESCRTVLAKRVLIFDADEVTIGESDTLSIASYSYIDEKSFLINHPSVSYIADLDTTLNTITYRGEVYQLIDED